MSGRKPWLLDEMTLGDVQKFGAERIHLRGQHAQLAREPVVHDDGGDRGREPDGGGDQRLGDARRDGLDTRRRRCREAAERRYDPPDRAEETDERRRARGGGEEREPPLEPRDLLRPRAVQRTLHRLDAAELDCLLIAAGVAPLALREPLQLLIPRPEYLRDGALLQAHAR